MATEATAGKSVQKLAFLQEKKTEFFQPEKVYINTNKTKTGSFTSTRQQKQYIASPA